MDGLLGVTLSSGNILLQLGNLRVENTLLLTSRRLHLLQLIRLGIDCLLGRDIGILHAIK